MTYQRDLSGAPPQATGMTTTSALIVNPRANRKLLIISNDGNEPLYVCRGATAVANTGIRLNAAGGILVDSPDVYGAIYRGPWSGITSSGTTTALVSEE